MEVGGGMAGHWEELSAGLRAELPTSQGLSCSPVESLEAQSLFRKSPSPRSSLW